MLRYMSLRSITSFSLASFFMAAYLWTLPINNVKALSNIFVYASLLFFMLSIFRSEITLPRVDSSIWFLGFYLLVVTAAVLVNRIDVSSSLGRLRTGLGEQLYVLCFSVMFLQKYRSIKLLLAAMAFGFSILVFVTLFKIGLAWTHDPGLFSAGFHIRQFSPGYGITALFFLPLLFGCLVSFRPKQPWLLMGYGVGAIGFLLAISYNSTSSVILVGIYVLYLGLRSLWSRYQFGCGRIALATMLSLCVLTGMVSYEGREKIANQYEQFTSGHKYEMLSQRVGIWAIGIDCALDAPWYGYGYGQKKVALVCSNEKYVEPARQKGNTSFGYFRKDSYGSIGFHNQYIENWFVGGSLGFFFWLAFFIGAARAAWRQRHVDSGLTCLALPIFLLYMAGCVFNGLWEAQPMTKGLMVLLAWAWWKPAEQRQIEV